MEKTTIQDVFDGIGAELTAGFAANDISVVALRLMVALALGACMGLEREAQAKSAGLRTHMMIAAAACLFTLIGFEMMELSGDKIKTDPLRLIEAVTAGVAFLAAGTIFTRGGDVKGLTTGAGMWMAGAVGLACGLGHVAMATLAVVMTLIVMSVLRALTTSS